jgi:putative ABC transport system permease protein
MPREVIEVARALPGVAAVDTYRGFAVEFDGRRVTLAGIDFDVVARHGSLLLKQGRSPDTLRRALTTDGCLVTESFARRTGARTGERLTLDTPSGRQTVQVHAVFYDYSTDAGAVLVDRRLLARWWGAEIAHSMALYLTPGRDVDEIRRLLLARTSRRHSLIATPNATLRRHVLQVFDQTFRITEALQAIVVMVAVLGIVNTLTALILQRSREIGILRAVGAWAGQIRTIVLVEAGLIGLFAHLIGSLCGIALAVLLVTVINQQFFGWTIRLRLEPGVFLQALALMLGTALLAALLPARAAARRVPAEAMRLE